MLVEHDVSGFQIAMKHAALVHGRESGAELARDLDGFVLRHATDAFEQRRELLTTHKLHREKMFPLIFSDIVNTTNMSMRNLARNAHLFVETRQRGAVSGK